jgi:hypothetical protein
MTVLDRHRSREKSDEEQLTARMRRDSLIGIEALDGFLMCFL